VDIVIVEDSLDVVMEAFTTSHRSLWSVQEGWCDGSSWESEQHVTTYVAEVWMTTRPWRCEPRRHVQVVDTQVLVAREPSSLRAVVSHG
jgi:hypothetical protein